MSTYVERRTPVRRYELIHCYVNMCAPQRRTVLGIRRGIREANAITATCSKTDGRKSIVGQSFLLASQLERVRRVNGSTQFPVNLMINTSLKKFTFPFVISIFRCNVLWVYVFCNLVFTDQKTQRICHSLKIS